MRSSIHSEGRGLILTSILLISFFLKALFLHLQANVLLELAEKQMASNMKEEAAKNFHTATIYFRVLQSKYPSDAG